MLMFSLGLVGVANAELLCDKKPIEWFYRGVPVADYMAGFGSLSSGDEKQREYYRSIFVVPYAKEFKVNDKESICAYLLTTIDKSYLNTKLTPQDIEQFERWLAEKGKYQSYEKNKDKYLEVLKFLKYYNMVEQAYKYRKYDVVEQKYYGSFDVPLFQEELTELTENHGYVIFKRFVYGKYVGDASFDGGNVSKLKPLVQGNTCKNKANTKEEAEQCKILKPALQWAEEKLKQAK